MPEPVTDLGAVERAEYLSARRAALRAAAARWRASVEAHEAAKVDLLDEIDRTYEAGVSMMRVAAMLGWSRQLLHQFYRPRRNSRRSRSDS